jgi:SAM-dependent methyltransferase
MNELTAGCRGYTAPYLGMARANAGTDVMSPTLDTIAWRFAEYAQNSRLNVLDVGCGDGIATAAALDRGAYVIAADPDRNVLRQLLARVRSEQYARLTLRTESLDDLDFKIAQFAAVHAGRVLHALEPAALQRSLRKFCRWLYPEGKLFVSTYTPEGRTWEPFRPAYEERVSSGERWPGFIADTGVHFRHWNEGASAIHLLDQRVLCSELADAGFVIEYSRSYPLPWDSGLTCCGVIARCEPGPAVHL